VLNALIAIAAMEQSMTMDFLHGMIAVLMPSMLAVAWMVWQATPADAEPLDHQADQFADPVRE